MKDSNKKGRLVTLFAGSYATFSVLLLICVILVSWASNAYYNHLAMMPDMDNAAKDQAMCSGKYSQVNVYRYFGKQGGFAVFDEQGTLLYADQEHFPYVLDPEEVFCIQDYNDYAFIRGYTLDIPKQGGEYLAVKTVYSEDSDEAEAKLMLLDKNYRVLSGAFQKGKKQYTERQYRILTQQFPETAELLRTTLPDGKILVSATPKWDINDYTKIGNKSNMIYWLLLPIFLLTIALFIFVLNKRIKKPLLQLGAVINRMAAGDINHVRVGKLRAPYEIRKIAENFDEMADRLAASEAERCKLDADRQKLLADISHDLKTPITVICGYTNAIADGKASPEQMGTYLTLINDKAEELNTLLNSFYEYNKVNHPEFRVQPVVTDICEFMREYIAHHYDEINIAGFTLRIEIPEKTVLCAIDAPMLRRALNNILYNSMKYNTHGTVMRIRVAENEGRVHPNTVSIRLADNGIGIDPQHRNRIFEPFVTGSESRGSEGSGLGLSITKRIVEAHGGSVQLLEKASHGFSTEFEILLPAVM